MWKWTFNRSAESKRWKKVTQPVRGHYDSMLGKLIVHAADREQAIARAERALRELRIVGVATSVPVALDVLRSEAFRSGDYDTGIAAGLDRTMDERAAELVSLAAAVARFRGAEHDCVIETVDGRLVVQYRGVPPRSRCWTSANAPRSTSLARVSRRRRRSLPSCPAWSSS